MKGSGDQKGFAIHAAKIARRFVTRRFYWTL